MMKLGRVMSMTKKKSRLIFIRLLKNSLNSCKEKDKDVHWPIQ